MAKSTFTWLACSSVPTGTPLLGSYDINSLIVARAMTGCSAFV
ncbi:hypothetical protein [Arthrobacter sp. VKM Ac-2550]|nr:hypothetical protein [Arthrobacter sp. VKM Ac-2550]